MDLHDEPIVHARSRELLQAPSAPSDNSSSSPATPAASSSPTQSNGGDAPADAPSPPPPAPQPQAAPVPPTVPPAAITPVTTPQELASALSGGARDIEVRSHLDLRPLGRRPNPASAGISVSTDVSVTTHPLYQLAPTRSLRGACGEDPAPELDELATELRNHTRNRVEFPPLKPYQCMLVVDDSLLMAINGTFWMDSLYFVVGRNLLNPDMHILDHGAFTPGGTWNLAAGAFEQRMYVTNTTFVGEGRGSARAMSAQSTASSLLFHDCMFSSFTGDAAPLQFLARSYGTFRRTEFRDMYLREVLFDVSVGSTVRLEDCSFANITAPGDMYVGETFFPFYDDAPDTYDVIEDDLGPEFDIQRTAAPAGSNFDTYTLNDTMSDCLYRVAEVPADVILPGCPPAETRRLREQIGQRVGTSGGRGGEDSEDAYSDDAEEDSFGVFLALDDPWLVATRKVLPRPEQPPGYFFPVFPELSVDTQMGERPPMPDPLRRDNVAPERSTTGGGGGSEPGGGVGADIVALACVLAALLLVGGGLLYRLYRRRRADMQAAVAKSSADRAPVIAVTSNMFDVPSIRPDKPESLHTMRGTSGGAAAEMTATLTQTSPPILSSATSEAPPTHAALPASKEATLPSTPSPRDTRTASPAEAAARFESGVVPQSAMNPNFEYALPQGLSLLPAGSGRSQSVDPRRSQDSGRCGAAGAGHGVAVKNETYMGSPLLASRTGTAQTPPRLPAQEPRLGAQGPPPPQGADTAEVRRQQALDRRRTRSNFPAPADDDDMSTMATRVPDLGITNSDLLSTTTGGTRLSKQLDLFDDGDLFLGRFRMLGRLERRRGGQAVVQFATDVRDEAEYAVKFFLDAESFYAEAALYAACFPSLRQWISDRRGASCTGHLLPPEKDEGDDTAPADGSGAAASKSAAAAARFLPQVEALRDGVKGELVDPRGAALPPCIVMERGESLQEWSNRAEPDLFQAFAVLANVAQRMADMHEAGYVHRDLKPANVMWLPQKNRWTVIDFGCAARTGCVAPLSFTLTYAAPEAVRAYLLDKKEIHTTEALDAWSLGVMAFELLTGAPAFRMLTEGRCQVLSQLRGDVPLPWEGDRLAGVVQKLGAFKGPVLQLLEREPSRRVSMQRFCGACTRMVAFRTTVEA